MQNPIPPQVFFGHIQKVREQHIKEGSNLFDSIILINGKTAPGNEKTVAIVSWFLAGYNVTGAIIFITMKEVVFYASDRNITRFHYLLDDPASKKCNLIFHPKSQNYQDSFNQIWNDIHKDIHKPKVGLLLDDSRIGTIAQQFDKYLKKCRYEGVQILQFFNKCFMVKDELQIDNLRKSSKVTGYFEKKLIKQIESIIDKEKIVTHRSIAKKIQQIIDNDIELKRCTIKINSQIKNEQRLKYKLKQSIDKDYIQLGGCINIQSGGTYTNKLFIQSNDQQLKPDCIFVSIGTLYRSYNSYIARTLLIDPTVEQKNFYKKIQTLYKVITQNLRIGVRIMDVYKKAADFIRDNIRQVNVPKSLGFGIGIFLYENNLSITQNNQRVIQNGFVFLINLTFTDLQYENRNGIKIYGVQIIDTVYIDKSLQILTIDVVKSLNDICYNLDQQDYKKSNIKKQQTILNQGRPHRRHKQQNTAKKIQNIKQRNQHQILLKQKKFQQLKQRVNENFIGDLNKKKIVDCSKIQAYRNKDQLPKDLKANIIYMDNKNNSILLPINGKHIPFHVHFVKSVVKNDEGKYASLRFNFYLPNSLAYENFPKYPQPAIFIKQMVFRSQQLNRIAQIERQFKNLQKKVKMQNNQKHAKEGMIEQQKINLNRGKRPILRDLYIRPNITSKKHKGNLQCHMNGFRYQTVKGEEVDVAFSNIKIAFFQPCQHQIIAAIHFKLYQPILIGKKKTEDVQFYSEGTNNAEEIVGRNRRNDDSDDEEKQKQSRKKTDKDFMTWIKSCQQYISKQFDFQYPKRKQGFHGVTYRANSFIQPTKSCLINLTQIPFFVLFLDDVQIASFQRMHINLRYFDITFIMKDYESYVRISQIQIKLIEVVKNWLDNNNIIFYDTSKNFNWNKVLANIRGDFKKFVIEDGGWTQWDSDDQEEEIQAQDGDSQFSAENVQESDQASDSDESDQDEYENEEDDQDDSVGSEEEELSEEGLQWEEMEARAERDDRERARREAQREKGLDFKKKKR